MKKNKIALIFAGLLALPVVSSANDYSTVTTVKYVQQCMERNSAKMNLYEATYKCSCVIDELAGKFTQTEFEEADTAFQLKNLPGDRGGEFKDDQKSGSLISRFQKVHAEAYKHCGIR